jgi:SOS-response transcriptional repressor LexA
VRNLHDLVGLFGAWCPNTVAPVINATLGNGEQFGTFANALLVDVFAKIHNEKFIYVSYILQGEICLQFVEPKIFALDTITNMDKWYLIAKTLLKRKGGGYRALAEYLGVETATVGHYMTGRRNPTPQQLVAISEYLNVDMSTLFSSEIGELPPRGAANEGSNVIDGPDIGGTVPLISSTQAGDYVDVIDNLQPGQGDRIPVTVPVKRYTFALRVEGDSMEPEFMNGVLIVVEPEMEAQPGDYVVVRTTENTTTFKQLVRDGADWFLKPLNERYPIRPLPENAVICGVVREQVKRYR